MFFYATKKEIWNQPIRVKANSKKEALEKILEGDYEETDEAEYFEDTGQINFDEEENND